MSGAATGGLLAGVPDEDPEPPAASARPPPARSPSPASSPSGSGAAAMSSLISAMSNWVHSSPYCAHQVTPFSSSNTRSLRSPAVLTKKFSITRTVPSSRISNRSLPSRSKRATCSGPICSFTTLGASSVTRLPSKVRVDPSWALRTTAAFMSANYPRILACCANSHSHQRDACVSARSCRRTGLVPNDLADLSSVLFAAPVTVAARVYPCVSQGRKEPGPMRGRRLHSLEALLGLRGLSIRAAPIGQADHMVDGAQKLQAAVRGIESAACQRSVSCPLAAKEHRYDRLCRPWLTTQRAEAQEPAPRPFLQSL